LRRPQQSLRLDRKHEFVDDFSALFANDMRSQQLVGFGVRDQFHDALTESDETR
jgi:hypothetical protein